MTHAYRLVIHDKIKDFEALASKGAFFSAFKQRTLRQLFRRVEKTIHIENELMDRIPMKMTVKGVAEGAIKLYSSLESRAHLR